MLLHFPQTGPIVRLVDLPAAVTFARRGRAFDDIAAEAKVSAATIRRIEAGEMISVESILRLGEWMKVSVLLPPTSLPALAGSDSGRNQDQGPTEETVQ